MIRKPTRIAIALVLALGLILGSANVALAKPQPVAEIVNLHLDGTSLHFQLHLVNLHQAFYYKVGIRHNDGSPVTDTAFSPIGRLSREGNSAEISRGIADFGDVSGHYDVQVELFNRKQVSLGSTPTATYTCYFTVTFYETTGLSDVAIQVFSDPGLENQVGGNLTTDSAGNAAVDLPDGATYYYGAAKIDYYEFTGNFTIAGANLTEDFTMKPFNIVTFVVASELEGISIQVYSDSALQDPIGDPLTTDSYGEASIKLPNGTFYWAAAKTNYFATGGNFTLSDAPFTVNFEMLLILYTVAFNETNDLYGVGIEIYNDYFYMADVTTNTTGQATVDLPIDSYYYYATKSGYYDYEGNLTVSDSDITESFTMSLAPGYYSVTLNNTNGLSDVVITIWDYWWNQIDLTCTNMSGQATSYLPSGDYFYEATKSGYALAEGGFTVPGSGPIISFTMIPAFTVTFNEINGLSDVYIEIYDVIAEEWVDYVTTNETGQAAIDLPNSSYDFYAYMGGYYEFDGNFTVSSAPQTVPFEMIPFPTVTFNETNGLSEVYICVYEDSALTDPVTDFQTDESGQATIGFEYGGTYYYEAMRYPYGNLVGDFAISDSDVTESFTMNTGYTVGFQEANSLAGVLLQLYSDSGLTIAASSPFATYESGGVSIDLSNGTYYYKATKWGFDDCAGNFTISGAGVPVDFEMVPLTGVIFGEDFTGIDGGLPAGWVTNASDYCYVTDSNKAGGHAPELELRYGSGMNTYYDYYVATPPIDATNTSTALNLSFKSYFDLWDDDPGHPYTYAVQTSDDDGATWTTVLQENPTFDTYPSGDFQRTENIDISACAGTTFRICWRLYGYTYWMDYWNIDDILVIGS